MKRRNAIILSVVWLLVMVSIVASTVTLLASGNLRGTRWVSRNEHDMIERYARLEEVRRTLSEGYYKEVDEDALVDGAIRGMMASLGDPYTYYYTTDQMTAHNERSDGFYQGVGFIVQSNGDGNIEVSRVYPGGPADVSGVRVGDCIVAVDGASVSGANSQTFNFAVDLIKGDPGTEVVLTVLRGAERFDLRVARGEVNVANVASAMLPDQIGYIEIFQFTGDVVNEFTEALQSLESQGARALIVDVRGNPGGVLDNVVAIADQLLGEGIVVYTEGRDGGRQDFYSDAEQCDLPLAVLINDMSASASEILAAAVQDTGRGTIVGTQSYGKGVVQTVLTFASDGAGMQYTSAQYFTPAGKNIHGTGVTPDVVVESDYQNYSGEPDVERDIQLQAAIAAVE